MDRLASMGVFVAVVDLGSFAAAARHLRLSAPMVGKHIQFLESRIGVSLISRSTRRHVVTEIGRSYYDRCRSLLAEAEAADAMETEHRREPAGRLKVAAPVHFGRHCVMPVLLDLARTWPRLTLEFAFSDRMTDLIEEGFDLAIRTGTLRDGAGLMTLRVAQQTMIVCAAPDYLARSGAPQTLDDLPAHTALVYRRAGPAAPWCFPAEGAVREWSPAGRFHFDDLAAIADACEAGHGLAWLPSWLVRDRIGRGALRQVFPDQPGFPYDAHAIWPQSLHLPVKVRHAIDALAAGLPAMM